jgi:hypothetical protein
MRRLLLLLVVALVMAAMMAASALPVSADPPIFTGPPGGPDSQADPRAHEEASPRQSDKLVTHCEQLNGTGSVVVEGTGSGQDQGGGNCV